MKQNILVTGGAGYIGSHIVHALLKLNEDVIVLDDLSTGFSAAIDEAKLIIGDVGDSNLLAKIFADHHIEAVIHLAAHTSIDESISSPLKYYFNNTVKTQRLLSSCATAKIKHFIFSSTAAVYGCIEKNLVSETDIVNPANPYGTSKLMCEWMLRDLATANSALNYVILRYFNVAGADVDGKIGQSNPSSNHLFKNVISTIIGKNKSLPIYGEDYATPDGTCIRDYIHVEDIALAHIQALNYLRDNGVSLTLNCGYGQGSSVREVIAAAEKLTNISLPTTTFPRRAGDVPIVVADASKIQQILNWQPRYNNLEIILQSALNWELNRKY